MYITELFPGCKTIGYKYIFRKKLRNDGYIEKFKARHARKCFKQKERIDFHNTYSSVIKITTIRVLIALAAIYILRILQMDVKIVFLNGELDKKIYMDKHKGFPSQENEVCKLVKSFLV